VHRGLLSALLALVLSLSAGSAPALIWPTVARDIERDLGADDVAIRRRAAERLPSLPGPILSRAALAALDDPDPEVRLAAAQAARDAALPTLGDRVIGWLTESDVRLRIAAAEALAETPTDRGVTPLIRALSDTEPSVRRGRAGSERGEGCSDRPSG
jgi:HEAT repeat protein